MEEPIEKSLRTLKTLVDRNGFAQTYPILRDIYGRIHTEIYLLPSLEKMYKEFLEKISEIIGELKEIRKPQKGKEITIDEEMRILEIKKKEILAHLEISITDFSKLVKATQGRYNALIKIKSY